jgi:hypothetical protein
MPAHLQAVIDAYYLDGLTERQTAHLLGITRHRCRLTPAGGKICYGWLSH